jgi:hypothetical protein
VLLLDLTMPCPRGLAFLEAFAVADTSTPSTLYAKDAMTGACEPAEPVSSGATFLRLGEALSPTSFPEIERALQ